MLQSKHLLQSNNTDVADHSAWALDNIADDGPITRNHRFGVWCSRDNFGNVKTGTTGMQKKQMNWFDQHEWDNSFFRFRFFVASCG